MRLAKSTEFVVRKVCGNLFVLDFKCEVVEKVVWLAVIEVAL